MPAIVRIIETLISLDAVTEVRALASKRLSAAPCRSRFIKTCRARLTEVDGTRTVAMIL